MKSDAWYPRRGSARGGFRPFAGRAELTGPAGSSLSPTSADRPDRQPVAARVDHGMIGPDGRSRRGPQMSATPDSTLANPEQRIADLERQLAERKAERDAALQRETATAEVLQVINSSPSDLAPVFDAMLEKATRLCEAVFGTLSIWDGERFHWVAFRGLPTELVEALKQLAMIPVGDRRTVADRIVRGEMVISMPDLREAEHRGVPMAQAFLRHGARSCVTVALRKEERLLGLITIYREEARPFSDK